MGVSRGDLVVVATRGAYTSRPRPAVVVQADLFNDTHASISVCPVTSDVIDAPLFRVNLPPGARTGLETSSQVMVDKIVSVPRAAIGDSIGRCSPEELDQVADALRRWLAL
jgi:mRNA interferase MazF